MSQHRAWLENLTTSLFSTHARASDNTSDRIPASFEHRCGATCAPIALVDTRMVPRHGQMHRPLQVAHCLSISADSYDELLELHPKQKGAATSLRRRQAVGFQQTKD